MGLDDALLVILGWALGLLGGPITDRIRRAYTARDLKKAVLAEIRELRYTMANCANQFAVKTGTLDHELLAWLEPIEKGYDGPDKQPGGLNAIEQLTALSPQTLRTQIAAAAAPGGLSLKRYALPFVEAQASNFAMLPLDLHRRLLRVGEQLNLYNQDVDFLNQQFAFTFDGSLDAMNHTAIRHNLGTGYVKLVGAARRIADAITEILEIYDKK